MENRESTLVHLLDVSRGYQSHAEVVWAVNAVDLQASDGEFVCIFGTSGSGKTTLLNLIAGLDLADSGEVQVAGHNVGQLSEDERALLRLVNVGFVFQDDALIGEFTAAENVALPLEARGVASITALAEAAALLQRVGLTGLDGRFPEELSGGQRQRVGIARALAGGRQILIADEPTGALDSKSSVELFELISELCKSGTLAIVCSHDSLCREHADSVYEMVDGRLSRYAG